MCIYACVMIITSLNCNAITRTQLAMRHACLHHLHRFNIHSANNWDVFVQCVFKNSRQFIDGSQPREAALSGTSLLSACVVAE